MQLLRITLHDIISILRYNNLRNVPDFFGDSENTTCHEQNQI